MGFNYSTNNFLGLGETLSLEAQLGTRMRDVSLGFTEPYFLDRPLQLGFVVYLRRFNFDQGREASILAGQNLIPLYNQLGTQNLLNYVAEQPRLQRFGQLSACARSFARVGLTYGYDISNIVTQTTAAKQLLPVHQFQRRRRAELAERHPTSHITPSYTYNTVNHPITPTAGRSIFVSVDFAGSVLGGNVNTIRPALDVKYFKQAPWHRTHILAFHAHGVASSPVTAASTSRPSRAPSSAASRMSAALKSGASRRSRSSLPARSVNVLNDDGSARTQKVVTNGVITPHAGAP